MTRRAAGFTVSAALVLAAAFVACGPGMVGPGPERCRCGADEECTPDGLCRPVAGPWGVGRDAGGDR